MCSLRFNSCVSFPLNALEDKATDLLSDEEIHETDSAFQLSSPDIANR